ncbi:hypothetical protein J437_LFUL007611 [Ladona fulva]|uniref:Uncharacterized protein n=1 Tax=Ladona fulva TaxID=123851 RepID=A0A8K0P2P5_LADFU|nr:hypothetical protein J437_LFUL007611 [Ladona fulva]
MALTNVGKVAIGWTLVVAAGIGSFVLSKRSIDQKRFENMQIRERMRKSNTGEYSPSYRKFSELRVGK